MKRNRWSNKQKLQIVLEGIRGETSISELCNKYGIAQSMYYNWRDLLLNGADRVFVPDPDKEKARMKKKDRQAQSTHW